MPRYATGTKVDPAGSREEIERTLMRYGADSFASGWSGTKAQIAFRLNGRHIKFTLVLPSKEDHRLTPERGLVRSQAAMLESWEAACRQRWRALALIVKAKLEAIDSGITTFEEEFLPHTVMPSGETVSEWVKPYVKEAYESGRMPDTLPVLALSDNSTRKAHNDR